MKEYTSQQALEIVQHYAPEMHDNTRIEPLEHEFPKYPYADGVLLMHAEDNKVGAFKGRGALVGAKALQESGARRLIVPSAGNHARGAVVAGKLLQDLTIEVVVPTTAPPQKRQQLRNLWNSDDLIIHERGDTFDESLAWTLEQVSTDRRLLHPYDDPNVTKGQGTLVDDLLDMQPNVKNLVLPVGGGGLLTGTLDRLREHGREDVNVFAVEAVGSNSLSRSVRSGEVTNASEPNPRYGGSAVKRVGERALRAVQAYENIHVLSVSDKDVAELTESYRDNHESSHTYYEPTSLVAIAALKQLVHLQGETVVYGTGRNQDPFVA